MPLDIASCIPCKICNFSYRKESQNVISRHVISLNSEFGTQASSKPRVVIFFSEPLAPKKRKAQRRGRALDSTMFKPYGPAYRLVLAELGDLYLTTPLSW